MSKAVLIIGLFFFSFYSVQAQNQKSISEEYSRCAVTVKLLDYVNGKYHGTVRKEFRKVQLSDKFDNNNVGSMSIKTNISNLSNDASKVNEIIQKLNEEKTGNQIVAKWYNRQEDGSMNAEVIHQRGLYNAADYDVVKAEGSKRGVAMLKDMGFKLLKKSYIVVVDYENLQNEKELDIKDQHGFRTPLNVYLFRVKYNADVEAKLFTDMWIYGDDDDATKQAKKKAFDEYTFEIEHVSTEKNPIPLSRMQYNSDTKIGQWLPQKSNDELLKELVHKGFDRAFFLLEKRYEDFRVKTPVFDIDPIRAKIGKKEDLKVDHRFFVYEYVYNEKKQKAEPKKKAVIRAKKVANNKIIATGQSPTSRFYQITGGKVEKGMTLQQRMDWGISILGRTSVVGNMGGAGAKISYNVARFIPISQLKLYAYISGEVKDYENASGINLWSGEEQFSFLRFGGGLSKGYYFARRYSLEPFIGAAVEQGTAVSATYDDYSSELGYFGDPPGDNDTDDKFDVSVMMVDFGADLGMHVTHWMKLVAGIDYHVLISNAYDADGNDYELNGSTLKYTDFFDARQGMAVNVGLHIEF